MVRSMTAFARASESSTKGNWIIEIRSLNHRYLDISLHMPSFLSALENPVREWIQSQIHRGKITVNISLDADPNQLLNHRALNESVVRVYLNALRKIQKQFKLEGSISISDLLKIPGIFAVEQDHQDPQSFWPAVKKTLKKVTLQMLTMKEEEGRKLLDDIQRRLENIAQAVRKIAKHGNEYSGVVLEKLKIKIKELVQGSEKDDDRRIFQEAAFLAERSDITEEIVRMESHLNLFSFRYIVDGKKNHFFHFHTLLMDTASV